MDKELDFKVIGIATALKQNRFVVPVNQREYSWHSDEQVQDLLVDINRAVRKPDKPYFLGTVVLTAGDNGKLEIADGQQRLSTTTMILSAIRDWFRKNGDTDMYKSIESDFLFSFDRTQRETVSKLKLNVDDNAFFMSNVLQPYDKSAVKDLDRKRSHKLIEQAYNKIKKFFAEIEKQAGNEKNMREILNDWISYLENQTNIVMLTVSNAENAFLMFETLNDRGLKTSQVDLVKNHIFNMASDRLDEAQTLWSSMKSAIESVSDDDDITIDFLFSAGSLMTGPMTKKEIMRRIQDKTSSKVLALTMMVQLEALSKDFAAILNPDHPKWNDYGTEINNAIRTLNLLGVTQIRPLMLAVANNFNEYNTRLAFKKFVSWSVRFIVMGIRGGRLDDGYSRLANKVFLKEIKTESELSAEARKIVISDAEFRKAFETLRVSKSKLARYYLRSLETTARNQENPEFIPNDDIVINLEHIMPSAIDDNWPNIKLQDIQTHLTRLGNMALLQANRNSDIGNKSFALKKNAFGASSFLLTNQIAELEEWNTDAIDRRQLKLAELAVKTWHL